MLFTEVDFLERFARASKAGFRAVECQFPYQYRIDELAEQLQRHELVQVLHNLPAGDWSRGDRGIACLPDRVGEFQEGLGRAIEYATALGCTRLNCLAGVAPAAADRETLHETFVENLRFAAGELKRRGITLVIEPLNSRDIPGFFLRTSTQAMEIIQEVGADNLYLQFDVYHAHIMEGDVVASIQRHLQTHRPRADRRRSWPARTGHRQHRLYAGLPRARERELRRLDRVRIRSVDNDRGKSDVAPRYPSRNSAMMTSSS